MTGQPAPAATHGSARFVRLAPLLALAVLPVAALRIDAQDTSADQRIYASIDTLIAHLYRGVSADKGSLPDWERFRLIFAQDARLMPLWRTRSGDRGSVVWSVEQYIATVTPQYASNGLHEREIARRTDRFGDIAHLFSTYETRDNVTDATPFSRGINSIQLRFDGTRWWILSILWDAERADAPLPKEYLP